MANLLTVDVTSGIPSSGTGTVMTINSLAALLPAALAANGGLKIEGVASGVAVPVSVVDGALVTIGAKADPKSTATDTTAITLMQVAKQISASVQSLVTALGSTAFDLGSGTAGSRTLRVAVDTAQTEGSEYETVAASQTDQSIGGAGTTGDYLSHVVVVPAIAACGLVTIKDNTTAIISFVGGGTTAMPSVAPFVIPVGMTSVSGAWKITTGSNVSCVAVGNFT